MHHHQDFQYGTLDRRRFIKLSTGLISGLSLATNVTAGNAQRESSKKPNILLIIVDQVGELINQLRVGNLTDDTMIIFTSDHGDMLCQKNMVQKRCFYEPSARVPLVIVRRDGTGPTIRGNRYEEWPCKTQGL